jgi:hypothetical protein
LSLIFSFPSFSRGDASFSAHQVMSSNWFSKMQASSTWPSSTTAVLNAFVMAVLNTNQLSLHLVRAGEWFNIYLCEQKEKRHF